MFNYAEDVRLALCALNLAVFAGNKEPDETAKRGAYWLAIALGRCRLFGQDVGEYDGVLPAKIALAAVEKLREHAEHLADPATYVLDGKDPDYDADKPYDWIEQRMQVWAALVAIDEAYQALLVAGADGAGPIRKILRVTLDAMEVMDTVMQAHMDVLCWAAGAQLLNNLRSGLAEPYNIRMPWWLDGTLEAHLAKMHPVG